MASDTALFDNVVTTSKLVDSFDARDNQGNIHSIRVYQHVHTRTLEDGRKDITQGGTMVRTADNRKVRVIDWESGHFEIEIDFGTELWRV